MRDLDKIRYSANIRLTEIGVEGQKRLLDSHLLIVGCGALGGTSAMYCAASGVGHIRLIDFDTIDISNLQRQVFYTTSETGQKKGQTLAEKMRALNPDCDVEVFEEMYSKRNAEAICKGIDFIIDAADNPATTYLIEEIAEQLGIGYVTAGVSGWRGQLLTHIPGGVHFSDIYPPVEDGVGVMPCSIEGVAGPLTGTMASLEACEAIKYLAGIRSASSSLLHLDLLTNTFQSLQI